LPSSPGQDFTLLLLLLIGWAWLLAGMGDRRGAYRVLMGEPEGKRLLAIPRRR